ncbi:MAG: PAS domain S-box protein [Smithellaceae bacterium]|jgi:PAS domain S-box-containing protein/putative nucleotidyltransferase with HDIG domain|nr:PAS domain S-box protein [Smithellaceae bacterium]HOQ71260.1 PAS domain S-box protein [Smithellaceae bacterium]
MTARVLIVDDDGNNRLLLETLLKSRGFEVLSAVNGEEGLARARSHHPDLIVSDILMPVMDGYTFCRQLKSDDALKRIPFVFFTASYNTPKDEEFAMSLGAERFVFKPQEPEELIAILEEVLKESRLTPRRAKKPLGEEMEFFRQHNEVLFNQLEKKLLDLEQANERLRMMEEQYRLSFENITDMVLVFDGNLTITSVSPSAERILGYRPEEFVGRPIDDLKTILTPESFQMAVQNIGQILQGEIITSAVYDVIARDGTRKYLDISGSPLVRDGKIDGLVCDARDVTERVLAESARRESEELFGQFMRYFPGSAYIKDSDRRIIYLTGNTEEYFGVKPQEWLGKRSEDIWPEEIALLSRKDDEAVLRGEVVQSISQRPQKDGAHTWITHRFPIHRHNKPPLIGCISLDITGQKQAEENLRESEKRYRELYDFLPIPVYEMDFQSTITSVNHAIYETFGGTEEDFKRGFKAWQLLTPEAVEQSVENIQRLLNGEPLGGTEYRLKRLDGTEFPAIVFSRLIFEQGKPVGLRGAVVNITDRKRTEEVIRESEANFRRSMDDSPLGIRVVTADGETLYANRAILDMYGYASIEEFQGVPLKQRYTPESYAAYLARRAKRDRGERDQTEYTIDIVTQNGDIRNVRAFRKQIVWNGQPHDQIIYQDITRQIQAEEALRESVGNLRKALGGTIRAIASVVETKDPYTAGHQRRVADIARAIAQEMKLPRERIDGLRMAGIIHDIGKVSVPSEILSSPRKLSSLEFSLIKTHAQSGHDIVREIEFPWPIARIIIEHHERMDGSGYPNALTGDQILPESRILAVADVVEAMATHRPYRPSLGLEAALDEITQNRGRLYDPEVVDACLRLFREKDYTIRD